MEMVGVLILYVVFLIFNILNLVVGLMLTRSGLLGMSKLPEVMLQIFCWSLIGCKKHWFIGFMNLLDVNPPV